ncbi:MAG: hypothetical protein LYZ69_07625 [Nitrososphaerales archaeon]|nr:hypothetical protein [Nitrososphaerales archaeon]
MTKQARYRKTVVIEKEPNGAIQDIRGELLKEEIEWDYSKAVNILLMAGVIKLSELTSRDREMLIGLMEHDELPIDTAELEIAGKIAAQYIEYVQALIDGFLKPAKK